jgi:hypothetical protein
MLADVIALLPPPQTVTFRQFSSFPASGNSPDVVSSHDLLPVWKWAKPESPCRKRGFWEAELDKVLDDGEWNGGRELVLLVRRVSKEILQNVRAEGCKIISSFLHNKAIEQKKERASSVVKHYFRTQCRIPSSRSTAPS